MKKSYILTIVAAFLLIIPICLGVTGTVSSFYGQSNPFNVTFIANNNVNYYLSIPSYVYSNNITFTINKIPYRIQNDSNIILRDTADITLNNLTNVTENTNMTKGYGWTLCNSFDGGYTNYSTKSKYNGTYGININSTSPLISCARYFIYNFTNKTYNNFTLVFYYKDVSGNKTPSGNGVIRLYNNSEGQDRLQFGLSAFNDFNFSGYRYVGNGSGSFTTNLPFDNNWHKFIISYGDDFRIMENNFTNIIYNYSNSGLYSHTVGYISLYSTGEDFYIDNLYMCEGEMNDCSNESNYLYPYNVNIIMNNTTVFNQGGFLTDKRNVSINNSLINDILSSSCSCENCSISGTDCLIPINFYSSNIGIAETNITNATYSYGIDNCSNSFGIPSNATAYNISFKDTLGNPLEVNYTSSITYLGNSLFTSTKQLANYSYCIYPNWFNYTANLSIQYIYTTALYTYNTEDITFDNVLNYLNFTVESGTANVLATVYNEIGNEIENAYINVLKYNYITGNYESIGLFSTNFEGQVQLPLTQNTQLYRFYIYYPYGILKESTNPTYIYSTSITFYIDTGQDFLTDYFTTKNMFSYLTFNNNTNNFRYEYADTSNEVTSACMYVYLTQYSQTTLFNSTCGSGSSGILLVGVLNTSGSTYVAKTFVNLTLDEIPIDSLSVHFPSTDARDTIGLLGILIDILLTISFSFILFFSVPLAIIFIPLPTVMLSSIGFLAIDPAIAWGLELAALVLAFIMHKRE